MASVCSVTEIELAEWYVPPRPAPRSAAAAYRRRRLVALMVTVAVVVVLGLRVGPALGSAPASAPERPPAAGAATYVVRPGDTLWSIASRARPDGDVRDLVADLMAANGGDTIRVGQTLVVPADASTP